MADFIDGHFQQFDLDLRKSHFGRFMDQKDTPDNLSFICDCIRNYVGSDQSKEFTKNDIWFSKYLEVNVRAIYGKPSPSDPAAHSEYDKFVGQPLRLLAYAGVLNSKKAGIRHVYSVQNYELLDYIALRQTNALHFLDVYLSKVLRDSGELRYFTDFAEKYKSRTLEQADLVDLKERYCQFIRGNTGIQGEFEPVRIFNKVLNIFAVLWRMPGEKGGKITDYQMIYKDLEYNEINWRDQDKDKSLTRKQAAALQMADIQHERITDYEMQKAKQAIKDRCGTESEVNDSLAQGSATQVHHIFPDKVFPKYRATLENLILLTASQHNTRSHPNNNTQVIDAEYQRVCLLAKADSIKKSIEAGDGFYSLDAFIDMLNELKGFGLPKDSSVDVVKDKLTQY